MEIATIYYIVKFLLDLYKAKSTQTRLRVLLALS